MQRYLISILILSSIWMAGTASGQATPTACPADIRGALARACPCDSFKNHGLFMKCVRKFIKASGCSAKDSKEAMRCAATSICGKARKPVICCNRRGHAKILTADKCTGKGGTIVTGAISLCDANCPAAARR